jgi:UDP-glucuronate 4-epimerase
MAFTKACAFLLSAWSITMLILVTGAAGFIGYHTSAALLERGMSVVGIVNLSDHHDVKFKEATPSYLNQRSHFRFVKLDVSSRAAVDELFQSASIESAIHLAGERSSSQSAAAA